ncbi:MAG: MraY family glycosyltransferase [Bacteroidota bacterium]
MNLPIAITTSFLVTLTLIPIVIKVFKSFDLLDQPNGRKIHRISTPSLGGIAVFFGLMVALVISLPFTNLTDEKHFLVGVFLIFLLGVRDDLSSLQANHKLVVQVFAATLVVFFKGIKISGLNGLFGIDTFGWYFDELFTIFLIVIMTNAFNLIDGIDGLAGSIGLLISITFCFLFTYSGHHFSAILSLALAGAVLAFLIYNWYPSKVFMGDTGSMMLGFVLTVLFIRFLSVPLPESGQVSPVALVFSLFILPTYDTSRVLLIRFFTGKHLLTPDRNHIHHVLLKLGYNHGQSTILLVGYNLILFLCVVTFQPIGELWLISSMTFLTVSIGGILDKKIMKREAARMARIYTSQMNISKTA